MFRILLLGFLLSGTYPLYAISKEYSVKTVPNVRLQDRNNHVSNPDRILSQSDATRINELLTKLENSTSIEVAVVAVNNIGYKDARSFATELFNHWGIGKKKDNNGLLIQLITEPNQRSVVFEVGYGLEGILPDVLCYRIQQEHMIDDLKSGQYSAGMVKGVEAVVNYLLASDYERTSMYPAMSSPHKEKAGSPDWGTIIILTLLVLFILWVCIYAYIKSQRVNQCPKCNEYRCFLVKETKRFTSNKMNVTQTIYSCYRCGHTKTEEFRYPIQTYTNHRSYDEDSSYYSRPSSSRNSSSYGSSYSSSSSNSSSSSSSSGSSGSKSSSSSSGSSRSSGSSYGGGRSGGGGAISRF